MARNRLLMGAVLAGALAVSLPAVAQDMVAANQPGPADDAAVEAAVEPASFFGALVERYRGLSSYEDVANVVEVRTREGRPPLRVETRIACRLEGDRLTVTTPGSQVRAGAGLDVPLGTSPAMEALVLRYNLWLAPHMALHFVEDPLQDLRLGVPEGFTAAGAETVTVDQRDLVRLELRSADGASSADDAAPARFDFWVDPESMLIERIEGRQRLSDGADYETALQITPVRADGDS
ncbi:MAG: hypothetical protein ACYSU7_04620 [Planctomycetota bacterium]|jgi:hypothetical protein